VERGSARAQGGVRLHVDVVATAARRAPAHWDGPARSADGPRPLGEEMARAAFPLVTGRADQPAENAALVLVGRGGVEPPTFHFSGGRSYQLSYLPERGETLQERCAAHDSGG
jgi:hypothetical protein